ncbi:hypothetical protein [Nonomuraea sp. bgisy101]|uniref:hypothetical protein n=1 Tax=Nonomuraea sp. bgisy101 TaxID=3413784 RepID=UPI003D739760
MHQNHSGRGRLLAAGAGATATVVAGILLFGGAGNAPETVNAAAGAPVKATTAAGASTAEAPTRTPGTKTSPRPEPVPSLGDGDVSGSTG